MADQLLKSMKSKRSSAKGKFHRIYNTFVLNINGNAEGEVISQILQDLNVAYADLEDKHAAYIECLNPEDDENDKAILETADKDIEEMYKELCSARSDMATKKRKEMKLEADRTVKKKESKMMIKKLEAPMFSGNIR